MHTSMTNNRRPHAIFQGLVLAIKWDSFTKVRLIDHPILFIAGMRDQLVPNAQMMQLHTLAKNRIGAARTARTFEDLFEVENGKNDLEESFSLSFVCILKS